MSYLHTEYSTNGFTGIIHMFQKHYFIHNQPPVETENEELQKLLKLLPTLFNAYFSSPQH
jgi:hypothetical protein